MAGPDVNRNGPDSARSSPAGRPDPRPLSLKSLAKQVDRELYHGFAGRDLVAMLVLHHHVDQHPARFFGRLLGLDDSRRLNGIAGFYRLDPARLEAAVD